MWSELDKNTRRSLVIGISVLVALTAVLVLWVYSGGQKTLFNNLENNEAARVIAVLEEMKVPYTLADNGSSILVSEEKVDELRVKLEGRGITADTSTGFELFDNADIGMTEYNQKINFLRAMQGELARSVMAIEGVKFARVHLVLPETSLFKQKKNAPTASVTVIPEKDYKLQNDQVASIQRLVAAATPGIEQDNVTIIDNYGHTLSRTDSESSAENITSMLLKKRHEVESYLQSKVDRILAKAFGDEKSVAMISVDLNLDKVHRKEEVVLPNGTKDVGLLRKREMLPQTSVKNKNKNKNVNGSSSVEVEYQISKRIEEIISMPGAISKIQLGVLVPENTDDNQVSHLKDVIGMSIGLDVKRGDSISIYPMAMEHLNEISINNVPTSMTSTEAKDEQVNNLAGLDAKNINERESYTLSIESESYLIAGLAGLLILSLILLILSIRSKNKIKIKPLSSKEREALLAQFKQWLNSETAL